MTGPLEGYDPPQDPLVILHQDHEILIVDKPAGLLSVPGKGEHLADCLMSRIEAAFPPRSSSTGSTATPRG